MKLSIVSTLYQSAAHIEEFHRRSTEAAASLTDDYEIVFVDDGSPDDSLAIALRLVDRDPHVRVVELSRNFGHHKAMMVGLEHARGEFVFLIDVDLEEDPAWLSPFWDTLVESRSDVVFGFQRRRKGGAIERLGGALHWWAIRQLSSVPIPENLVTARLMTKRYVRSLLQHREHKTAIGGLWVITGYKQTGLPVEKTLRGPTSYSFAKRLAASLDGLTAFSDRPLILVFVLGLAIFAMASMVGLWLIVARLSGQSLLSGWASVMLSVWLLGGLTIASIGVLGLYVARVFIETKARPYVIIRDVHEHGEPRRDS